MYKMLKSENLDIFFFLNADSKLSTEQQHSLKWYI